MLGMFGIKIMSENQLLNGYANGITPNVRGLCVRAGLTVQKLNYRWSSTDTIFLTIKNNGLQMETEQDRIQTL